MAQLVRPGRLRAPRHEQHPAFAPASGATSNGRNVGLYDDHGQVTGLVGIGRDMTDQRRIERELRELAAEHGALERVATEVARGLDEDVVFRLVAEQAGRLVGADGVHARPGRARRPRCASCRTGATSPPTASQPRAWWSPSRPARPWPQRSGPAARPAPTRLPTSRGGRTRSGDDDPIRSAVAAPITVTGEMWGALVAWRVTEEPLSPDTERRLGAFASLAGTAIANADARTALAPSRERIVAAGDAARGGSSATCTTAPSSGSCRSRSRCGSR